MTHFVHRRGVLHAGLALCVAAVLPPARACEFFTSTLRVNHPWTRATPRESAFAVVCMSFDEVTETDRLIGVESPVAAGAELFGEGVGPEVNLLIPEGRVTELSEAGTHVRLVGLHHPLHVARDYPLRLVFEKGGVVSARLNVDYSRFL